MVFSDRMVPSYRAVATRGQRGIMAGLKSLPLSDFGRCIKGQTISKANYAVLNSPKK